MNNCTLHHNWKTYVFGYLDLRTGVFWCCVSWKIIIPCEVAKIGHIYPVQINSLE